MLMWFLTRNNNKALWEALACGNVPAVQAAIVAGADPNARDGGGMSPLRHALRQENVPLLACLLQQGATPDAEAVGSMALWAERAVRDLHHKLPTSRLRITRAKLAITLLDRHKAPWDLSIPSLGSGDSARFVIEHAFPGCLPATSG